MTGRFFFRCVASAVVFASVVGCGRGCGTDVATTSPIGAPDAAAPTVAVARPPRPERPPMPGDFRHGWELFQESCITCHGAARRGDGMLKGKLPTPPADLRDPVLLASRTNTQLANIILHGGKFGAKAKEMPGFASQMGEQDVMDVVAFLRGDSIHLEECFADATHYDVADSSAPKVFAAFRDPSAPKRAAVIASPDKPAQLSASAQKLGYLMFIQLPLGTSGNTPVAFLSDVAGNPIGIRVALPPPDNLRAEKDLESIVFEKATKLPSLHDSIEASLQRLREVATKR